MSELKNVLTISINKLFSRKLTQNKRSKTCEMCLKLLLNSSSATFNLSEKTMKVLLNSVLLAPLKINCCSLILCEECSTAVAKLSDLFAQMESLSNQFNELRRSVGKQLISTALNLSHIDLNDWEKQVRDVEHIVPSCLNRSGNLQHNGNTILQADNSINSPNEIAGEEDRANLIQATPVNPSSQANNHFAPKTTPKVEPEDHLTEAYYEMYCEDSNESYVKQEGPSIETLIIADATHSNNNDRDTPSPQTNPFETSVINPAINQTRAVLNNILGQPLFNHYEPRFEINSQAIAPATKENFKIPNLEVLSPKVTASFVSALGPPPPKKKQKTHEPPVMRDGYLVYVCEKCDTPHSTANQKYYCCTRFICKICSKAFVHATRLRHHMSRDHSSS